MLGPIFPSQNDCHGNINVLRISYGWGVALSLTGG